jgi:hypothetical protein
MNIGLGALAIIVIGLISYGILIAMAEAAAKQGNPNVALLLRVLAWTWPLQLAYVAYRWHQMGAFSSR